MRRLRFPVVLGLTMACAAGLPAQQSPADLSYLSGAWNMLKDGFSFTVHLRPVFGGRAFVETSLLDENNRVVGLSILAFDEARGHWTRTQVNRAGEVTRLTDDPEYVGEPAWSPHVERPGGP